MMEMKKDKEWLKEEVKQMQNDGLYFRDNYSKYDQFVNVEDLIPLINQLDEAEVLSQEEVVVTYFSPFTELPVMVETETHKYMIEATKIIEMEG